MWYKNSLTKSVILGALPIIATIVDNVTGEWTKDGKIVNLYITGKLWVLVIYVIFIIAIIFYAFVENREKKENKQLADREREIFAYKRGIDSMRDVFDFSQDAINKLTKNFAKNRQLDLREWNFEAVATYICKGVYSAISEVAEKGTNFTVNIYVKEIDADKKEYVTMIAHEGENRGDPPNIFGVRRMLKPGSDIYYSMKQFADNNPKINVLSDKESIKKAFSKYKDSYNQYVGIPICYKGNNMISLLEIIAHNDSVIANSKSDILEIINKYVICYQYFALFAHQIEKNMITTINVMNAERSNEVNG